MQTRSGVSNDPAKGDQQGFALLEGLVAIALLAGTMVAIFALVGNILNSAYRVGRSNASVQVTLNALEVMNVVNPMLQESGKIDLGPYTVSWTSRAIAPTIDRAGSLYQTGLYDSDVRVEDKPGSVLTSFALRQVGYRRVREPVPFLGYQSVESASGAPAR
jgi:type II secretory pathway pseudopilin PulG